MQNTFPASHRPLLMIPALVVATTGCLGLEPEGIAPAQSASTTVKMDFYNRPLPEIPLPNDIATRHDPTSATMRRINASMVADTSFESHTRKLIDTLDGWGIFQPITIPFTGPLDVASILAGHRDSNYGLDDDVVYLINVDGHSPSCGKIHHLDVGHGNYPVVLESLDKYWKNDPRGWTLSLLFEEEDEDTNGNGKLDPGEDTDADGLLDEPNYLPDRMPGKSPPAKTDLAGRADALMTFYERQTNTLIVRPLEPLEERTTYAVVVTRRLKDIKGQPVGSPYPYINHTGQNQALAPLPSLLPRGLALEDVAFAFSFTTQSVQSEIKAVRDGLYGHGVQAQLGQGFPALLATLEKLKDPKVFTKSKNLYLLHTEHFTETFEQVAQQLLGLKKDTVYYNLTLGTQKYVDYYVIGSFDSPQLFERKDAQGEPLPYNDQSWPPDLDRIAAKARRERVYFSLAVPRKEVSARGQGRPAPVVILGHGYGGNRGDIFTNAGLMAKWGLATIAIDCPSHGLGLSTTQAALAKLLVAKSGLTPLLDAVLKDRAFDQNNDETPDSGADFWSAYVFHTRDMVRQATLDYMQLVRILRSFDGKRSLAMDADGDGQPDKPVDLNGDGKSELAGDFDGDGAVDVGGSAIIAMTGGSLGGIMSMTVGSTEPEVSVIAPVAGGAGLGDVGLRSRQGGVPEAFLLRLMAPLYVGTLDSTSSEMKMEIIVPDLNKTKTFPFATVKGVRVGDTVVVQNKANNQSGCGVVSSKGEVRVSVASDAPSELSVSSSSASCAAEETTAAGKKICVLGDDTELRFYRGEVVVGTDCKLKEGAAPFATVSKLEQDITYQNRTYFSGRPLVALTEGLGLRRASPELRRFASFAQFIIEPGDPVAYLRYLLRRRPLTYEGTGQTVGSHALICTTVGDMGVPASSGVTAGRVAGLIGYLANDPRQGKSANQVLLDTHTTEAVNTLKRYTNAKGEGIHTDVDNFSRSTDMWGITVPRLAVPLRAGLDRVDALGGISGAIFPLSDPKGSHGFDMPGQMTDTFRKACKAECTKTGGTDPCGCDKQQTFDIGLYMFNMIGRYFASGGKLLVSDLCNSRDDCADIKAAPQARDKSTLD